MGSLKCEVFQCTELCHYGLLDFPIKSNQTVSSWASHYCSSTRSVPLLFSHSSLYLWPLCFQSQNASGHSWNSSHSTGLNEIKKLTQSSLHNRRSHHGPPALSCGGQGARGHGQPSSNLEGVNVCQKCVNICACWGKMLLAFPILRKKINVLTCVNSCVSTRMPVMIWGYKQRARVEIASKSVSLWG